MKSARNIVSSVGPVEDPQRRSIYGKINLRHAPDRLAATAAAATAPPAARASLAAGEQM